MSSEGLSDFIYRGSCRAPCLGQRCIYLCWWSDSGLVMSMQNKAPCIETKIFMKFKHTISQVLLVSGREFMIEVETELKGIAAIVRCTSMYIFLRINGNSILLITYGV